MDPMVLQGMEQLASKRWHSVYRAAGEPLDDFIPLIFNYWEPDEDPFIDLLVAGFQDYEEAKAELQKFARDGITIVGSRQRQLGYYGRALEVSYQLYKRDRQGVIQDMGMTELRLATHHGRQYAGAALFDNAFNTAFSGIITGEALCGTHANSATNYAPTAMMLGEEFLIAADNYFASTVNYWGRPTALKQGTLLTPGTAGYKRICREIMGSAKVPYSPENQINAIIQEELQVLHWRYLGSSTACFVLAEKVPQNEDGSQPAGRGTMGHDLNFVHGPEGEFSTFVDPDAMGVTAATYSERIVYHQVVDGIFGSQGSGA